MSISIQEASVYLALFQKYSDPNRRDFTLMVRKNDARVLGMSVDDARTQEFDSRSSVINLLQANNVWRNELFLASSASPRKRDLGMGQMRGLRNISYSDGDDIFYRTRGKKLFSPWSDQKDLISDGQIQPQVNLSRVNTPSNQRNIIDWYEEHEKRFGIDFAAESTDINKINTLINTPTHENNLISSFQSFKGPIRFGSFGETASAFSRKHTQFTLPGNLVGSPTISRNIESPVRHDIFMKLAWAIVGEGIPIRSNNGPITDGANIGSILRGPNDEILWWGLNTNSEHGTLHGEVNLIQTYHNKVDGAEIEGANNNQSLPVLYSTLEPCHMCAGMYVESGREVFCYFGHKDPNIRNNALETSRPAKRQEELQVTIGHIVRGVVSNLRNRVMPSGQELKGDTSLVQALQHKAVKSALLTAINYYFDLVPTAPGERRDWVSHKVPESHIWENGLKLLHHINPGVKAKWEARTDRYYDNVI